MHINTPQNFSYVICISFTVLSFWCAVSYGEQSSVSKEASIKIPGADLANYPNSAFTLPQGRAYIELSPVNYSGRSRNNAPAQYSAGYLLRYGLVDDFELRLLSAGYTVVDDDNHTQGMSPQAFDFKWHLMDEQQDSFLPAMAIEASLQTNLASSAFKNGLQPALSLNFDQTLPYDIALEYNIGFITQQGSDTDSTRYQLNLSWAFQRDITDNVAAFINGYTNTASGLTFSAIGSGLQWTPSQRVALFTNISAGLTASTPSIYSLVGFAVAF